MSVWEDRVAINDALARYADGVNRRDAALWASAWHEEAEWVLLGAPVRGKPAIVAAWEEAMAGFPFAAMHVTQGATEIAGEHAEGRSYTSELLETTDGRTLSMLGAYRDRYRKHDGRWAFVSRRFTLLRSQEN